MELTRNQLRKLELSQLLKTDFWIAHVSKEIIAEIRKYPAENDNEDKTY